MSVEALHLVPSYAARLYGAGNWKACQAMAIALRDRGVSAETMTFDPHDDTTWPTSLSSGIRDVVIEYSTAPELVASIRRIAPRTRVHVRAHNAEARQHLHRTGMLSTLANPRNLYAVTRLLARDAACRRMSQSILSISEWDAGHYWSHLPGRAAIATAPYFSPWPTLRSGVHPRAWNDRRSSIVCMPGARDAIGQLAVKGFHQVVRGVSPFLPNWRFEITKGVHAVAETVDNSDGIETIAELKEPWDLLCDVKTVAVMTPLGFGAKTTVFDALAAGCHVLVHPTIATRLPAIARRACIVVNPRDHDWKSLANQLVSAPASNDVNDALHASAVEALAAIGSAT